jgi:ribose transport system permease protein
MTASPVREPAPPPTGLASSGSSLRSKLPGLNSISLLLIWAAVIVLFGITQTSTFLTTETLKTLAADQAITAIMALALLLPLAAGAYDLSIGGVMGLAVVLVAYFQSHYHLGFVFAILLTLCAGLGIGAINAFVIVRLRVDSFIATLGMSSVLLAAVEWINGGQEIVTGISTKFTNLGSDQLLGFQLPFYYMLVIGGILWYVLEYRQAGRYMYAIGSNPDAARLAGVRTGRLTVTALLGSAFIASLAGVIFTAEIGSATNQAGPPYLLPAFAAAFLGATQFRAKVVNVPGTLIAVYALATGIKGLQLSGAAFWVNDLFNGLALIIAVAFAVRASRKRA